MVEPIIMASKWYEYDMQWHLTLINGFSENCIFDQELQAFLYITNYAIESLCKIFMEGMVSLSISH